MDIDLPSGDGPFPVVVWVHGGGWTSGDSSALVEFSQRMTLQGIAGVRINYRLANAADAATLEDALSDVLTSIEWVRSNAETYHFDMKRFGIGGASAGGHLSALAAQQTPECIAYVGYCGGYDMLNRGDSSWPSAGLLRRFLGGTDEATLKASSPIWQIRQSPPDTLLLHGTADKIIDPDIAIRFAEALRSQGGTVKLVLLEGASHGICHQPQLKRQCLAESEACSCAASSGMPRSEVGSERLNFKNTENRKRNKIMMKSNHPFGINHCCFSTGRGLPCRQERNGPQCGFCESSIADDPAGGRPCTTWRYHHGS